MIDGQDFVVATQESVPLGMVVARMNYEDGAVILEIAIKSVTVKGLVQVEYSPLERKEIQLETFDKFQTSRHEGRIPTGSYDYPPSVDESHPGTESNLGETDEGANLLGGSKIASEKARRLEKRRKKSSFREGRMFLDLLDREIEKLKVSRHLFGRVHVQSK